VLAFLGAVARASAAQLDGGAQSASPLAPAGSVTVAAGPEYEGGGWRSLFLGEGYRRLWTTPVSVPQLDLTSFAGGLTPVRQIGRQQTSGLALAGADGQAYTFRSLRKEPERVLPVEWRDSFPARIVRDHTSALHPGAALLLPPLAEALGVLHTVPQLVLMPDSEALGSFRADFGGHLGTIELYPQAGGGRPGFGGASELLASHELWERRLRDPAERVDARAFLRARILDLLVENYDRHAAQWRWARLPGHPEWVPLPEDPDMAFIRNEGLAFDWLRGRAPKFVKFSPQFPGRLEGSTFSGAALDRWLLAGLDAQAFEDAAREAQARLTDDVVSRVVSALPPEWRAVDGARTASALTARRSLLVDYVRHYYRDLAREVDVHATDADELVTVTRAEGGALELSVAPAGSEAYYRRRFLPAETAEVRVYLHGGDDRVVGSGRAGGPIRVRLVAGAGRDELDAAASGGLGIWRQPAPVAPDPAAPWQGPRDHGRWTVLSTQILYASELDLVAGLGVTHTRWGFRSEPEAARHDASLLWSTGESSGRLAYAGLWRRPGSRTVLALDALGSGIERTNFFGFGNDTPKPEDRSGYRTLETFASLSPSLRLERSPRLRFELAATLRSSHTPTDRDNVLNATAAYGRGSFLEAGLRGGLSYDTRGFAARLAGGGLFDTVATGPSRRSDLRFEANGFYFPSALDVREAFGGVEGELAGYLGRSRSRFQLAARVGGRRVWGEYPWFESAFLGGRASLRGYSRQRFAGDASLYAGVEARAWLFAIDVPPCPLRLGVLGFADAGRVWLAGESSDTVHPSWGGGLMLQPVATPHVITAALARGREGSRFYLGYGFFF
jgi:hypothetical protein